MAESPPIKVTVDPKMSLTTAEQAHDLERAFDDMFGKLDDGLKEPEPKKPEPKKPEASAPPATEEPPPAESSPEAEPEGEPEPEPIVG